MRATTRNAYGTISIKNAVIASVAAKVCRECYGLVGLSKTKNKKIEKRVKVITREDHIYIDVYPVIKYGVSIDTVGESLKNAIKYEVEKFTGMLVEMVNVFVAGVEL